MRGRGGGGREGEGRWGTTKLRMWRELNADCIISHTAKNDK